MQKGMPKLLRLHTGNIKSKKEPDRKISSQSYNRLTAVGNYESEFRDSVKNIESESSLTASVLSEEDLA